MSSPVPSVVDLGAGSQTQRRLRYSQVRGVNTIDYVADWHTEYSAADIPAAVASDKWSAALNVQGYDAIYLYVDFTAGGTPRNLKLNMEAAFTKNGDFFTRSVSFDVASGNSTAIPADSSPIWANGTGAFIIKVDALGHFMRVQPTLVGGTSTGSRVTIKVQRVMLSL